MLIKDEIDSGKIVATLNNDNEIIKLYLFKYLDIIHFDENIIETTCYIIKGSNIIIKEMNECEVTIIGKIKEICKKEK